MTTIAGASSTYGTEEPARRARERRRAGLAAGSTANATDSPGCSDTGRESSLGVEDARDLLARLVREVLRLAGVPQDRGEHVLQHVLALDVGPVRGRRHEPAVLRRVCERRERRLRRVHLRE